MSVCRSGKRPMGSGAARRIARDTGGKAYQCGCGFWHHATHSFGDELRTKSPKRLSREIRSKRQPKRNDG